MPVFQKTILLTRVGGGRTGQLNSINGREAICLFPKVFLTAAQGWWGLLPYASRVEPVSCVHSDGPAVTSLSCCHAECTRADASVQEAVFHVIL